MFEYFESEKAKKKAMTTEEKKNLKKQKEELEAKYTTCLLDGRKEKVGNFRIEPPGLFRGRGDHPKKGALKVSVSVGSLVNGANMPNSSALGQKTSRSILARMLQFLYPI